jgi:hypothetical protein
MSLLNQINNLSFRERYQILQALNVKEQILVDSNKNDKPANLEQWQVAICNTCRTVLIDEPDTYLFYYERKQGIKYNVCCVCRKKNSESERERLKQEEIILAENNKRAEIEVTF